MKILIADNHAIYRDGLRFNLNNILSEAQIIDAASFNQAIEISKQNQDISLILIDLDIPEINWEDGIKNLQETAKNSRIGVISNSEDANNIKKVLNMGICCYLPKNIDTKVLNSALSLVLNGGTYYPPSLLIQDTDSLKLINGKKLTNRLLH